MEKTFDIPDNETFTKSEISDVSNRDGQLSIVGKQSAEGKAHGN